MALCGEGPARRWTWRTRLPYAGGRQCKTRPISTKLNEVPNSNQPTYMLSPCHSSHRVGQYRQHVTLQPHRPL